MRRTLNREAVLDAVVELFEEGSYAPTTNEIAERAGISPRSLFRYFDDVDDLNRAVIEREIAGARHLLDAPLPSGAPTATKIDAIVDARVQLHTTTAAPARAARLAAHHRPVVAAQVKEARTFLRSQVATVFAAELADRPALLPAVDALLSFETYELLRSTMTDAKVRASLTTALTALFAPSAEA